MDPKNDGSFAAKKELDYWGQVDLYIGGSEHATGHLLYSRFWNKFLKDLDLVQHEEPFQKLVNQGMIQGVSEKIYRMGDGEEKFIINEQQGEEKNESIRFLYVSSLLSNHSRYINTPKTAINVDVKYVKDNKIILEEFIKTTDTRFTEGIYRFDSDHILTFEKLKEDVESGLLNDLAKNGDFTFSTVSEVEKMSKSKYNVVNPDDIVARYGADTLRLYEMFLGPLEQSKPWSTGGIEGVAKFLRRFYRLYVSDKGVSLVSDEEPTADALRTLHKTLQKVEEDIEKLSFNTIIPALMICCNELTDLKCHSRSVLEPLTIAIAPLAPHIAEELWQAVLGHADTVHAQTFPSFNPAYLVKNTVLYPVSINGKTRVKLDLPADFTNAQVEETVLADTEVLKYLAGATPKKVIVVAGRMVNLVV
jgi:leucyl-tRNA synthetase